MNISVIIPAYNNKELLKVNLPTVIDAMDDSGCVYEIIIVDDAGTDGTDIFLKQEFPSVNVIRHAQNKRFPGAINSGLKAAKYEKVFLLNSDMQLKKGFLTPMLDYFKDEKVFAVANKAVKADGVDLTKETYLDFKYGLLRDAAVPNPGKARLCFGASGGHALFDKSKFLALGGYDEIFKPGYYEDADASYRAWKRGWLVYFEPGSSVYHDNMGTHSKVFSHLYIKIIAQRNYFVFLWKNLTDIDYLLKHILFLPVYLFVKLFTRRPYVIVSFFWALTRLGYIVRARAEEKSFIKCKDKEILQRIKEG